MHEEFEDEAARRRRRPVRRYIKYRPRRKFYQPMPFVPAYGGPPAGSSGPVYSAGVPDDVDVEPIDAIDSAADTSEFNFEMWFAPPAPFVPTPVENPGGGRIRDKRAPSKADLVNVLGVGQRQIPLHRVAASAWQAMVNAARAAGIAEPLLRPTSGFRDPARQAVLWEQALKKYGSPEIARKWVAPPGGSPHQSGRAIDLYLGGSNDSANVGRLRTLPAYHWLVANARRFGFYPYEAEPWHWEYNPPATR